MKSMSRAALVALAAVLAVCAVCASAAFAVETPEWYYSSTKPAPEWQQSAAKLSEAVATKSKEKVILHDEGVPAQVECEGVSEGTAGPGAADKTTSFALSGCTAPAKARNLKSEEGPNGCKKAEKAELIGLPWHTELVFSKGVLRDVIATEGKTGIGFKTTCETVLGKGSVDTCTTEKSLQASVTNTSGGVDAAFLNEQIFKLTELPLKCTFGGSGVGAIESTQLIEATKGSKLEANVVEGTYSKLTSSKAVQGTGRLEIEDRGAVLAAACNFTLEGTVGAGAKGTITSMVGSSCEAPPKMKNKKEEEVGNRCEGVGHIEPVGTPWTTELYESEGTIRDRITGGKEGPGWEFTCGKSTIDVCNLNVSPEITNGLEGYVTALFSESLLGKVGCRLGEGENGVWSGEPQFTPETGAIKAKL